MNKRSKTNQIVRDSITEALFSLMGKKNFSDITITEIITKAGVARVSYYRNYSSKEDILKCYIYDFIQNFRENYFIISRDKFDGTNFLIMFKLLRTRYKEFRSIFESGLSGLFLNSLNSYFEEANSELENKEINKWRFYAANGSFFNIINKWIMSEMKDDPAEIISSLVFLNNQEKRESQ